MAGRIVPGTLRLLGLAWLLVAVPVAAAESPRIALVIGNGAYRSAPLANPVNDADLLSATLRRVGFRVLQHNDLSQKAMKLAVREFADALEQAGADAVGLFYYSGHGIQVNGRNYMIPVNADIRRESDIDIEGVAADIVLGTMAFARNRLNLVIMDACRNNPFARSFRSATRGLARMDATRGTLIAYSTAPGQVAVDGEGSNSPYTLALANIIERPNLAVEQVFKAVRRAVMSATGNVQVPWESSSLTGDFYFSGGSASDSAAAAAPAAAAKSGSGGGGAELLFWESVKDSRDPAAFQAYLERFPDGVFSTLARIRGRQLVAPAEPVARAAAPAAQPGPAPVAPAPPVAAATGNTDRGVSIAAPRSVAAGAEFEVAWKGPGDKRDFITIVERDADQGSYDNYRYTRLGNPLKLLAPDEPGDYEIRYLTGQSRMTLASAPIRVSASAAALQAPESVAAGSRFRVSWEGPGNNRDLITIVASAADERSYANYTYTRDGNPLKLSAPDLSGRYEIRYLAGQSRATLARIPVIVEAVTATLQAPPEVAAGAEIKVVWEGPDNDRDLITIVAADADSGSYANYEYTRKGTPLKLSAPDQPGSYEIRYLTAQTRSTLAGIAIEVRAVEADLEAPERVPAGSKFKVAWTGPDNKRDFVTIVEPQTEERKYGNYAYTRTGNPLKLLAPDTPGSYEIRYLTAQTRRTLARRPVTVE